MTRLLARDWKFKIIILAFFTLAINTVEAQHECRSALGAHFKPISENLPINWATEIVLMPGAMSDRFIFNGMAIAGLEYYSKSLKHQFYFEGEYKYWYNSNRGPGMAGTGTGYVSFNQPEKLHFGFRELFYSYNGSFKIKAGIQSMKSAKSFLLDEGVFGISAKKKLGNLQVNLKGGTVYGAIAKMQDICGTRHLYNLVRGNKVNFVGENLLESNFILAELNWSPGSKTELAKGNFNEFESTDEFSDFNEFSSEEKATKAFSFKNATFRFYEEFGEIFPDYKFYGGATFEFELFEKLGLDAEILTQWMNENKALIYKFRVNREKFWSNGALSVLEAKYLGLKNIDDDVQHLPSDRKSVV